MLGHARVPMARLAIIGGAREWIELFMEGRPAGTINFKSDYQLQAAVVNTAPVMQPPIQPVVQTAPVVTTTTEVVVTGGGIRQGLLKLHAVNAHLDYHEGPLLERMNPVVKVKIGMQEWHSDVCQGGGRNPSWGVLNRMEHIVMDPMAEVYIEVRDKDMLIGSEFIGQARVPINMFLKPVEIAGHINEHIELHRLGF